MVVGVCEKSSIGMFALMVVEHGEHVDVDNGVAIKNEEIFSKFFTKTAQGASRAKGLMFVKIVDVYAPAAAIAEISASGLAGLTGIQPMRGSIIRPLLGVRRADIEDFLNTEGILYCTDETNLAPEGTRNRLRLEVIPYLERHVNPALVPTLCSTAELLMEDEAYLAEISQYELEAARQGEGFLRERLAALDKPIAARVIRLALAEVGAVVDT